MKNSLLQAGRVAVLGIGNELNGDDAVGVLVARALAERQRRVGAQPGRCVSRLVQVFTAGPAPEAFTGPLRRFAPDVILLVDAAELGEPPGTIAWVDWTETAGGVSASTHTLPPSLLAGFLVAEFGCRVLLVGIQPQTLEFDAGVSGPVRRSVEQLVEELGGLLF